MISDKNSRWRGLHLAFNSNVQYFNSRDKVPTQGYLNDEMLVAKLKAPVRLITCYGANPTNCRSQEGGKVGVDETSNGTVGPFVLM
jgi:hypothetical protein